MTEYKAIYKCRKCGKSFDNAVTGNVLLAQKTLICVCLGVPSNEPQSPTLYFSHSCANGDFGVADFVGWQKEERQQNFERDENGFTF